MDQWKASWIWDESAKGMPNVYMEARTSFTLPALPDRASLRVTANQEYVAFLNGKPVGRGPSPADNGWQYFDTYEVGDRLVEGENVLAVLAYNFGTKEIATQQFQGPGGLLAQLDVWSQGADFGVATDETWKVRRSPRWVQKVSRQHHWNGYREIYLADKEDGWELAGYDDTGWRQADVVARGLQADGPWPRLLEREIPFLLTEARWPEAIVAIDANYGTVSGSESMLGPGEQERAMMMEAERPGAMPGIVFDFAREAVGYMEIIADAPEGGVLQLLYGETLDMALLDTFVLKKGRNMLSPFGRRAFRYAKLVLQAAPEPVRVRRCMVRQVRYPFAEQGRLETSDPLLNRIWDTGLYTTMMNSQDHLEDCPLREKALWIADGVVMGRVIANAFGDRALVRKCLLQAARIQNADGSIPGTGPERNPFLLPDFCAHWLFGVYDYWRYTKDERFLADVWEPVRLVLEWFHAQLDETGLFAKADRAGWWCFIDWSDDLDRRDRVTAVSCFYYKALRYAAELGEAMGRPEQTRLWEERARTLREAVRAQLWLDEAGAFADCLTEKGLSASITLQTNFAAIWSGMMTEAEAERFLREYWRTGKLPDIKGAFFYHIVLETLFAMGKGEMAYAEIAAYWGGMLERGATTWWEVFDPQSPGCTLPSPYQGNTPTYLADHVPVSLCHGWGASPTYLLTKHALGVSIDELGGRTVRLSLAPGSLQWAKGDIPTAFGTVTAEWKRNATGRIDYDLRLPEGLHWDGAAPAGCDVRLL